MIASHPYRALLRSALLPLMVVSMGVPPAAAQRGQTPVRYRVTFPNRAHHEAEITVTFTDLPTRPLELRMSRSSPGRYALHEFGKNVYDVSARDSRGNPLSILRPDPYQWTVSGHDRTVIVRYTLYANRAGGTYSGIDRTHAHLNIPATFMWARGADERPVIVTFGDLPPEWGIATQLARGLEVGSFTAPNLQRFMDSPIELSDFDLRTWIVDGPPEQTIRLAIHHAGTGTEVDAYVEDIKKIVAEQGAVYGEFPVYDDGTYTFLADYLPHVSGDGMEHRNSTIVASQNSLLQAARGLLGTVSHEFFHSWNVERIRPRSLEPFNFESTNMSGELWLAEGFTSYYGPLTMHRAGLTLFEDYAHSLAGAINAVTNAPGRRYRSPTEMSMLAPFVDAATAIDPTSFPHTFISYYTWGQALGLALDLTLRQRFPGVTSDDFMREMWTTHGKTERPYTTTDARDALGRVSGDTAFAGEFWRRYVLGREIPDYQVLLAPAGLLVRQRDREAAWIGDLGLDGPEGATVGSRVLVGTPAYLAGLETGDRILSLDGRAITSPGDVGAILAARPIGDQIEIVFESRGQRVEGRVDLTSDPRLEVVTFEEAGREVTASIRAFRSDWLASKVK